MFEYLNNLMSDRLLRYMSPFVLWQERMGTSQQESWHKKVPRRAQEYFWVWAWEIIYFGAWKTSEYIKKMLLLLFCFILI